MNKKIASCLVLLATLLPTSGFADQCDEADLKKRVAEYILSSVDSSSGEKVVKGSIKISSDALVNHTSTDPEADDVQTVMHASFDTARKGSRKQSFVAVLVFSHGSPLGEPRCELRDNIVSNVEVYR